MTFYIDISWRKKALVRRKAVGMTVMNTAILLVLTAVLLTFCEGTLCWLAIGYRRFEGSQ